MTTVWHFAATQLRDGTSHPAPGWVSPIIANPVLCERGWHGSERLIDALRYAPGPYLAKRELIGMVIAGEDKHVASQCHQLTPYVDVSDVLVRFARHAALLALRVDAPRALRAAGLHQHADTLAALPDDCDLEAASNAAGATSDAAGATSDAAGATSNAAGATSNAAGAASYAAGAARNAAGAASYAAWAASYAAGAASYAAGAARTQALNDWLEREISLP